jgi:hypothetical protein
LRRVAVKFDLITRSGCNAISSSTCWGGSVVRAFDGDIDVKGWGPRAPRHDVEDGIFVLACSAVGGESRNVHFAPGIEVAIAEALKECIDNRSVQNFATPSNGTCDSMVEERVKWATTGRSGFVLWLVAAGLWRGEEGEAKTEGDAMSKLCVRQ